MRPDKVLKELADATLAASGGDTAFTILAEDPEESQALWALLKGRRGNKSVTIRIARPEEFIPIMDLARRGAAKPPEPTPAVVDDLDYDGY